MVNVILTDISDSQVKNICELLGVIPKFLSNPDLRRTKRLNQVYDTIIYFYSKYKSWPTTNNLYRILSHNYYVGGYRTLQRDLRDLQIANKLTLDITYGGNLGSHTTIKLNNFKPSVNNQRMNWEDNA